MKTHTWVYVSQPECFMLEHIGKDDIFQGVSVVFVSATTLWGNFHGSTCSVGQTCVLEDNRLVEVFCIVVNPLLLSGSPVLMIFTLKKLLKDLRVSNK